MAGLGPSDERLACCAWRHRSIENVFCYNCCLLRGAVVVSLSKRMDHMIVRFSECSSISYQNGCESRKRAARGLFRSSFRFFVLAYFLHLKAFGFLVGGLSIRRVQLFVHWATTGATATELRVKNATWFLLGSGVRIVHVLSLSIHNTFSTSAAICALGDNRSDRNRVTG